MPAFLRLQQLSFSYESATQPLFTGLDIHFSPGWTGIVGANGVGKSTLLKLATGLLAPQSGAVRASGQAIYCEQRTDDLPSGLFGLLQDHSGPALRLIGQLGLQADWPGRWPSLSHGERKRAQIATALWQTPDLLALDEPSNHIDSAARELLLTALRDFRGVGLLVSHDREMLDLLCRQCLFIDPPEAVMRPGGVTDGARQADLEQEDDRRRDDLAKHAIQRLAREQQHRREKAEQSRAQGSKSRVAAKDNDARSRIDLARVSGKDATWDKRHRQMDGRLRQAQEKRGELTVKKTYDLGIWLVPDARSQRDTILDVPRGSLPLGQDGRRLLFPDLRLQPQSRVALTGPNGSGKSTLLAHLRPHFKVDADRMVYVPQEISREEARQVMADVRALSRDRLGHLLTIVSSLGSRPQRLLESDNPSPGEIRKILLAAGIERSPQMIIMDEPTNHMDLPSIRCLEQALADCPCGLLLVSHDRVFLNAVTDSEWHLDVEADTSRLVIRP